MINDIDKIDYELTSTKPFVFSLIVQIFSGYMEIHSYVIDHAINKILMIRL